LYNFGWICWLCANSLHTQFTHKYCRDVMISKCFVTKYIEP
jgi:hypothetical protein